MPELKLSQGFSLTDLYHPAGLARIDQAFLAQLAGADTGLADRLGSARASRPPWKPRPSPSCCWPWRPIWRPSLPVSSASAAICASWPASIAPWRRSMPASACSCSAAPPAPSRRRRRPDSMPTGCAPSSRPNSAAAIRTWSRSTASNWPSPPPSPPGRTPRRRMRPASTWRPATPPGRCCHRMAVPGTPPASCSRRRKRWIPSIWCISIRWITTARRRSRRRRAISAGAKALP